MSPSKRDREYARRRYEKYLERQRVASIKRRRNQRIGFSVLAGVLAITLGVTIFLIVRPEDGDPTANETVSDPTDSSSASDGPDIGKPATEGSPCDPATVKYVTKPISQWDSVPKPADAKDKTWTAEMATNCGNITIDLDGAKAPQAVSSFVFLAKEKYFDNTICHRLVTSGIMVLQCGDPTATGTGGPGYSFGPIENTPAPNADGSTIYPAGTLAMANSGSADSNGSQFFIVYEDSPLDPNYTVFGTITDGLDIVKNIADGGIRTGSEAPNWPIAIQGVKVQ